LTIHYIMSIRERLSQKLAEVNAKDSSWVEIDIPYGIKDICKKKAKLQFNKERGWLCRAYEKHLFEKIYDDATGLTTEQKKVYYDLKATFDKDRDQFFFLQFQLDE